MIKNEALLREYIAAVVPNWNPDIKIGAQALKEKNSSKGYNSPRVCKTTDEIITLFSQPRYNYSGMYIIINGLDGSGGTSNKNIKVINTLKFDADSPEARVSDIYNILPPHFVVHTSVGKQQGHWRVSDCSVEQAPLILKAFSEKFGTDESFANNSRLTRLPGTEHCKDDKNGKLPSLVTYEILDSESVITVAEFLEAFDLQLTHPEPKLSPLAQELSSTVTYTDTVGDAYSKKEATAFIKRACGRLKNAPRSEGHSNRMKDGKTIGGFLESGLLEPEDVEPYWLVNEQRSNSDPKKRKDIEDGIAHGRETPIYHYHQPEFYDIDYKIEQIVERYNEEFAVVPLGIQTVIARWTPDKKGHATLSYMSFDALLKMYQNKQVLVGKKRDGEPIYKSEAEIWLHHPKRRTFDLGVTCEPATYVNGVEKFPWIDPRWYNTWSGYPVAAVKGDYPRFKFYLKNDLCDNKEANHEYLLNWTARLIQYPGELGMVVPVFRGDHGGGKSTLGEVLQSLFKNHSRTVKSVEELNSKFNEWQRDLVFMSLEEIGYAGNHDQANQLKSRITSSTINIEQKHGANTQQANRTTAIITGNGENLVYNTATERRYWVTDVPVKHKNDKAYYDALYGEMATPEALGAFLYDMMHRDISNFNVADYPETLALKDQRIHSLGSFEKYWLDALHRGSLSEGYTPIDWSPTPTTAAIVKSYQEWCKANNERYPISAQQVGNKLVALGYGKRVQVQVGMGKRDWGYRVGNLENAAKIFCEKEQLDIDSVLG